MNAIKTFENRIGRNRAFDRAVRSTHIIWSKSYPAWADALFDESFVQGELKSMLRRFVNGESGVSVADLVQAWVEHLRLNEQRRQGWSERLTPAARDFLWVLQGEFEYECQRRERSLWFKLWHGADSAHGRSVPAVYGGQRA